MGEYRELSWGPDFSQGSRSRGKARRYKAFVPDRIGESEPRLQSATMALCERAGNTVRQLNADPRGLVPLESLGRQLLRSEALASSQIEGLSIPHRKLAEAELAGRAGPHRALEIVGTIDALERATEIGAETEGFSPEAIAEIHRVLAVAPPLERIAGQIREEPSWIGGSSPADAEYVGPPHEEVRPLLDDLCSFMDRDDISPLPQAAIAHAQFELIHPFGDGNGRVGRCLVHALFRRRGLAPRYVPPVSLVLGANKDAYIAGLQEFRGGGTDSWVAQFARAVEGAAASARAFSAEVADLQSDWRRLLGPVRSDAAVVPLIELLPKYPVITAAVAEREIGRSRPATINALSRLHEVGALTRHRSQKKGDSWEAKELFDLLSWFEQLAREGASGGALAEVRRAR
jgi:Fic family protein